MALLYLRRATLAIGSRKFDGIRLSFTVEKTSESSANKATVTAYNLNNASKAFIEKKDGLMRLEAGYQDNLSILFLGDIAKVMTKRSGADITTIIESGDGEVRLAAAHVEIGLKGGATDQQVVDQIVSALAVKKGIIKGIQRQEYLTGFSFSGPARELLDSIARKQGLEWSIQNGALQIIPKTDNVGESAVLLNAQTGLLDVPNKTAEGFSAKSLLNPLLVPGRQVKIESELLTGVSIFKVEKVNHVGDTKEGEWTTNVEGAGYG